MFVDERIAATSRAIPAGAGRTALAAAGLSLLLHASALAGFLLVGQATPPVPLPIVAVELVGEPAAQPGVTDGEPAAAAEAAATPEQGAPDPTAPAPREVAEQAGPPPSDAIGELEDAETDASPAPAAPEPAEPPKRITETALRPEPAEERPTPRETRSLDEERDPPEETVESEVAEPVVEPGILPEPPPRKPAVPGFAKFPPPPERPPRAVEIAAPVKAPEPLATAAAEPVDTAAPAAPEQARPNLARGRDVSNEQDSNVAATGQTGAQLAAAMHGQAAPAPLGEGAGNPQPRYPYSARRLGQEGEVVLRVQVSRSGAPESVAVYRSSGHVSLDEEALRTVRRWRFEPARRRGVAVPGIVEVPILFQLTER